MPRYTKVTFQGREIEAVQLEFETVKEGWDKYKLEDGTELKVRTIVSKVFRAKEVDQQGNLIYVMSSTTLIDANVSDEAIAAIEKK